MVVLIVFVFLFFRCLLAFVGLLTRNTASARYYTATHSEKLGKWEPQEPMFRKIRISLSDEVRRSRYVGTFTSLVPFSSFKGIVVLKEATQKRNLKPLEFS